MVTNRRMPASDAAATIPATAASPIRSCCEPLVPAAGITSTGTTYGAALLANYSFDDKSKLSGVSVPFVQISRISRS